MPSGTARQASISPVGAVGVLPLRVSEGQSSSVRKWRSGASPAVGPRPARGGSAQALGLRSGSGLDPLRASSRRLGALVVVAGGAAEELLVCLGGTVTVDGGAGMREVLDELPLPTRVACDVRSPLLDAAYVFAQQKGATEEQFDELAERLRGLPDVPGAGAAGGLGGALAA